jgi:energy-coupling factor transporter ATP-binding protein EcfA2
MGGYFSTPLKVFDESMVCKEGVHTLIIGPALSGKTTLMKWLIFKMPNQLVGDNQACLLYENDRVLEDRAHRAHYLVPSLNRAKSSVLTAQNFTDLHLEVRSKARYVFARPSDSSTLDESWARYFGNGVAASLKQLKNYEWLVIDRKTKELAVFQAPPPVV